MKKFVVEIIICEHTENDNNDVLYIKKTYEICIGKNETLDCLEKHYKSVRDFINNKIEERRIGN